ncbi:MAG: hypothetical protein GXO89_11670 [Chlorobi bacterium]|nr:hypothetical protein [Chlorobiota bacterium]
MKKTAIIFSLAMLSIFSMAQTEVTIYQIQGQQDSSPYEGETVKTHGIVTGVFSGSYFIQDGEGAWNGVYVYSTEAVNEGDEVELTSVVTEYYSLTELKDVSGFTVLSTGNALPQATVLNTMAISDEAYEGVLVKVENAICSNDNAGYGEWELDDGSGFCRVDDLGVAYSPVLGLSYTVTGPLYYSFDYYKIEPRNESDIIIMESLYFTSEPEQINPAKTSVTIEWETNVDATTELFWGITPGLEGGHIDTPGNTLEHEIELSGLEASGIYYVRAFSVMGSDTTPNFTKPYATVSNSSGEVKLYFNHNVDYSVANDEMAVWTPNIVDTVIHYLSMAQQTLDITMYEQESDEIVSAINAAYGNGVQVRYITDDIGNNPALENLNENIPVLYGNTEAIMHNKFIIIDAGSETGAWLITGSLNHTVNNLGWDYNNMICIQDKSMALGFELEFEEMWGSDGPMYDEANAKFGAEKTDNTPHKFLIDDIPMEAYFSPSDKTTSKIESAILQAETTLEFGVMVFTENSLGNAVVGAQQSGLEISGIIDYTGYSGSEYQYLKDNGVNVREYVNSDGSEWPDGPVFHHKYAIIDFQEGAANPVLITGSHNWSASAESINDENTLFVYDANLANQFHQEFSQRFKDLLTPLAMDDDTTTQMNTEVIVNILDNDFIPEDVTATSEIVQVAGHGQGEIADGILTYVPDEGFTGTDSLSYQLFNTNMTGLSDTAWVRIAVVVVTGIGEMNAASFSITNQYIDQGSLNLGIFSTKNEELKIRLYSIGGKLLSSRNIHIVQGDNSIQMDIRSFAKGIMLLDISGQFGKVSSKLIY